MKWWLGLLVSLSVHADPQICSNYIKNDPQMVKAVDFLKRYKGQYKFGGCKIELHVCDSYSASDDRGDLVGDMLLIDPRGREFYVPLYFLKDQSDQFWFELFTGRITVNYKYEDRLPNPRTYGVESIELEINSEWDSPKLKHVEVGYYMRKDYIERDHENRYQWAVCEE